MKTVLTDDRHYTNIANKIREKTGGTTKYKPSEMPSGLEEVFEAGKQAEYDAFWNMYQKNGSRVTYGYAFAGECWNSENFKPKYPIMLNSPNSWTLSPGVFRYFDRNFTKPPLEIRSGDIDFENVYSMTDMFRDANIAVVEMNKIPKNLSNMSCTFAGLDIDHHVIHTIKLGVKETTSYDDLCFYCTVLKNVSFVVGSVIGNDIWFQLSTLLTKESIKNIFNALSTSVSGKTLTLTRTAVNNAFETSAGAANGSTSAEWLALIGTRSNWTISLV